VGRFHSIRQADDGGYIVADKIESLGAGERNAWVFDPMRYPIQHHIKKAESLHGASRLIIPPKSILSRSSAGVN